MNTMPQAIEDDAPADVRVARLGDTRDLLGESPFWDASDGALCWIDSLSGALRRRHADGRTEQHALPAPVGSVAPWAGGGAVVAALRNSFARYDLTTRALAMIATIEVDHPDVRLNDGKCDPWGNFIAGTMHINRRPGEEILGGLYRLRADARPGEVEKLATGFGLTNGPCFSLDGRILYVADSTVRTIWAYDYSPDGPLRHRRAFANTDSLGSGPDGATVDAQGHLWTVLTRVGQLARYTPAGQLERLVPLPATHPTSLCFGGAGLSTLYVTSISRSTHLAGTLPHDGGVFEVRGLPCGGLATAVFGH